MIEIEPFSHHIMRASSLLSLKWIAPLLAGLLDGWLARIQEQCWMDVPPGKRKVL